MPDEVHSTAAAVAAAIPVRQVKPGETVCYWPSSLERSRNSTLDLNGDYWVGIVTFVHRDGSQRVNLALLPPFPDDPLSAVERRLNIEKRGEAESGIRCWSFLP
jgi:hypothetical protein